MADNAKDRGGAPVAKRAKMSKDLPTKDEQKNLLQVDSFMRSNLLQMQISEILLQVSAEKQFKKKKLAEWLDNLVNDITGASLGSKDNANISPSWLSKQGFQGLSLVNTDVSISFEKPASVDYIGSMAAQTATAPLLNIDLAVTMPADMFDNKDILNHVYFDKRKLYIAALAKALLKNQKSKNKSANNHATYQISVAWFKGDDKKPILQIIPSKDSAVPPISVRLYPVMPSGIFKLVRLKANKNNVRSADWKERVKANKAKGLKDSEMDTNSLPATPRYNLAILEDLCILTQNHIISKTINPYNSMRETVILFKIWLTQRTLRFGSDSMDGHLGCLILAYLVQTRRITPQASALAAFQTLLTFLKEIDFTKMEFDFTTAEMKVKDEQGGEGGGGDYHNFPAQLLHPSLPGEEEDIVFNALWRVSAASLLSLRIEATKSIKELQFNQQSCFDHLFMHKRGFFTRHDLFFHFIVKEFSSNSNSSESSNSKTGKGKKGKSKLKGGDDDNTDSDSDNNNNNNNNNNMDNNNNDSDDDDNMDSEELIFRKQLRKEVGLLALEHSGAGSSFCSKAVEVVTKALGDRALLVSSHIMETVPSSSSKRGNSSSSSISGDARQSKGGLSAHLPSWPVLDSPTEGPGVTWQVSIGVIISSDKGSRRVERGPNAEDKSSGDALKTFRSFWGPKTQLRRFQDGSIVEAVVWEPTRSYLYQQPSSSSSSTTQKSSSSSKAFLRPDLVIEEVIRHSLGRHMPSVCGGDGALVTSRISSQLEHHYCSMLAGLIPEEGEEVKVRASSSSSSSTVAGIEDFDARSRACIEAFDHLRRILTSEIKSLPLSVDTMSGLSPALRYTAVLPPKVNPLILMGSNRDFLRQYAGQTISLQVPPLKVLLKLESSGKWPLEAVAIKKMKVALLLKLRTELKAQFKVDSVIHTSSLDVLFNGFIFRLSLAASLETECLEAATESLALNPNPKPDQTGDASPWEAIRRSVFKNISLGPLHHNAIKSLNAQFPSFSSAVRLLGVWLAGHYLTGYLSQEALELLVALEYVNPGTSHPPTSAIRGFYHALVLLSTHNWAADPLVVDLSLNAEGGTEAGGVGDITAADRICIVEHFRSVRSTSTTPNARGDMADLNKPMYIVSSCDKEMDYKPWSLAKQSPEPVVVKMLVDAAERSAAQLLSWMSTADVDVVGVGGKDKGKDKGKGKGGGKKGVIDEDLKLEQMHENLRSVMGSDERLQSCNVVFQFHKGILNTTGADSGPAVARLEVFANSHLKELSLDKLIVLEATFASHPVQETVYKKITELFTNEALFFWNGIKGDALGLVWRPKLFIPQKFSILNSKNRVAVGDGGDGEAQLTLPNVVEIVSRIVAASDGMLTNTYIK